MIGILKELLIFLKTKKNFGWPIIFFLFIFGGLLIVTQGTAIAPFVYSLFKLYIY